MYRIIRLLVVENYIRQPNVFSWYVEHLDVLVLGRVPNKAVIDPFLNVNKQ